MEKVKHAAHRVMHSIRKLPDKKQYVEFFTAILSVPVLITVILLNLNSLTASKTAKSAASPTPLSQKIYINQPANQTVTQPLQPTMNPSETQGPCKPQIGPITISSPQEGQKISDNPVDVDIAYQTGVYCSVVWSYRINGGNWSNFDDKSIALYNLPQGNIELDLQVQSVVSGQEQTVTRHFIYTGNSIAPTPQSTPLPTIAAGDTDATSSANQ